GPYLKHGTVFASLGADDDVLTIGLNRAVTVLSEAKTGQRRGPQLLREIGVHPEGGAIGVYRGRYGPYVSHDGVIASLPRTADPDVFSLEQAVPLLATQRQKVRGRQRKSGRSIQKPRSAAKAAGTRDRVTTGTAKKPGPKKASAGKISAKRPRSRPGAQPG